MPPITTMASNSPEKAMLVGSAEAKRFQLAESRTRGHHPRVSKSISVVVPAHNAARTIVADLGLKIWWNPPDAETALLSL